jgi:hypothetical protein
LAIPGRLWKTRIFLPENPSTLLPMAVALSVILVFVMALVGALVGALVVDMLEVVFVAGAFQSLPRN